MMTWTYTCDPANNQIDRCRFIVSDTDADSPIMQDEEIQYIIDTYGNSDVSLMYHLFNQAATIFARDIKRRLGPQSEDPTERLKFFRDQANSYKARLTSAGLSLPKYAYPKVFGKGMQNNPPWRDGGNDVW